MQLLSRHIITLILGVFISGISIGQKFADKSYYLVDSLDFKLISTADHRIIDSCLLLFHKESDDTIRIKHLNSIVDLSWDDQVWTKYNEWILNSVSDRLKSKIDKLSKKEYTAYSTILANAVNNKGYYYEQLGEYENASKYYTKALTIITRIKDSAVMAVIYNNIGHLKLSQGKTIEAAKDYEKSLAIKKALGDYHGAATTLNNLGVLYRNVGDIDEALKKYFESIKILEGVGDMQKVAVLKSNLGVIYLDLLDTTTALNYFNESIEISTKIGDKKGQATTHGYKADIFLNRKDSLQTMKELQSSLNFLYVLKDKDGILTIYNQCGKLYQKLGYTDEALKFYKKALGIAEEIENVKSISMLSSSIAALYYDLGNYSEAEVLATRGLDLAKKVGYPKLISEAARILYQVNALKQNWKLAYEYQLLHYQMVDSVRSKELVESTQNQKFSYLLERKKREVELLQTKNELLLKDRKLNEYELNRSRNFLVLISIVIIALLIGMVFISREWRRQKEMSNLLHKQKEILSLQGKEKESMLKEIHHRVKNNLQVAVSLLRLQSKDIENEEVKAMFEQAQNRIVSMALIHERMFGTENLKNINAQEYFETLISNIVDSYEQDVKVEISVKVEDVVMGINTFLPLGLIVNEIVSNSMKYAFTNTTVGRIEMDMKPLAGNRFKISIRDNGSGFNPATVNHGLGLELIDTFVDQLNGKFEILIDHGTEFQLDIENLD